MYDKRGRRVCAAWLAINHPLPSLGHSNVARCAVKVAADAAAAPQAPVADEAGNQVEAPIAMPPLTSATPGAYDGDDISQDRGSGGWVKVIGFTTVAVGVTVAAALWWRHGGQGKTRAAVRRLLGR